ncbi:MAG: 16S rRNA (adenine(1518)-N(6)/adenine(1519)-N(6))-dimethyltransferase RsmA [Proteobacteria bacterium]|nr:16S rRNA (adenine(1518)-N(6)/adenine(1519)-N(6))-dimethyltransferase RsmA [Pseudomonadota bacterium]
MTRARKRFGQHFLESPSVVANMIERFGLNATDRILEIGPGTGALSTHLSGRAARYLAIEIDRDLIAFLKARFTDMEIFNEDVLNVDFADLLHDGGWRVIGNLPYNISSPLMIRLLGSGDLIRDMHFMIQKEMADRMTAIPGTKAWGRLTVMMQYHCDLEKLFDVSPDAFKPPPKVWSTVVRITPKTAKLALADERNLDLVLRTGFSARRKRLSNAFRKLDLDWSQLDLDPERRPDQLTVGEYVMLANAVP